MKTIVYTLSFTFSNTTLRIQCTELNFEYYCIEQLFYIYGKNNIQSIWFLENNTIKVTLYYHDMKVPPFDVFLTYVKGENEYDFLFKAKKRII